MAVATVVATLACLAALPPGVTPASASLPTCPTAGLVIWLDTQGSGTAGASYFRVELTNLSGKACTLVGYGRVAAVDLRGRQVGDASGRFVSSKPTVTVRRGATASFVLELVDVGNFPASRCHPVTAAGLRVAPPHSTATKVIPFPLRACSRPGIQFLYAQAVRPGP